MRGSLGVWAEPLAEITPPNLPILELHINVWRDLPGRRSSIDFGFQMSEIDNLKRMFLYIPAAIKIEEVQDLSEILKFGQTLSAVFNDTVEITNHNEGSFDVRRSNGNSFRIFNINSEEDFEIEYVPISDTERGTIVKFTEQFCSRIRSSPNSSAYIRVRIHLTPSNGEIFYSYASPADSWLLSRFYRTELNEFRLNERRSFPDVVVKWSKDAEFRIIRVLYFLIRDFRYELLVQHTQFKRTRRLEQNIWKDYLSASVNLNPARSSGDVGERMLIYQWREDAPLRTKKETGVENGPADRKWIEDFSAFASFRSPQDNIWNYVLAILALGALGGAVQAIVYAWAGLLRWPWGARAGTPVTGISQALICCLALCVALVVIGTAGPFKRRVLAFSRRIRARFSHTE